LTVERESIHMIDDHIDEEVREDVQLSDVELKAIHSVIGQAAAELNALKKS
jgi:hypothetical protein